MPPKEGTKNWKKHEKTGPAWAPDPLALARAWPGACCGLGVRLPGRRGPPAVAPRAPLVSVAWLLGPVCARAGPRLGSGVGSFLGPHQQNKVFCRVASNAVKTVVLLGGPGAARAPLARSGRLPLGLLVGRSVRVGGPAPAGRWALGLAWWWWGAPLRPRGGAVRGRAPGSAVRCILPALGPVRSGPAGAAGAIWPRTARPVAPLSPSMVQFWGEGGKPCANGQIKGRAGVVLVLLPGGCVRWAAGGVTALRAAGGAVLVGGWGRGPLPPLGRNHHGLWCVLRAGRVTPPPAGAYCSKTWKKQR